MTNHDMIRFTDVIHDAAIPELKPCPICGHAAEFDVRLIPPGDSDSISIRCSDLMACGIRTPWQYAVIGDGYRVKRDMAWNLALMWNKRVST